MAGVRRRILRILVKVAGFFFIIGATIFAIAYFTTDIPDPKAYVNSQATIFNTRMVMNWEELVRKIEPLFRWLRFQSNSVILF